MTVAYVAVLLQSSMSYALPGGKGRRHNFDVAAAFGLLVL